MPSDHPADHPPEHPDDPFRRDPAVLADDPRTTSHDTHMFEGALSFCRRPYVRRAAGLDLAVVGVPFDSATSNRPGTRFGPRAIRAASAQLSWSHAWPSAFDPFERLRVGDWGDIHLDPYAPAVVPGRIEAALSHVIGTEAKKGPAADPAAGPAALVLGGDHYVTYPALRAAAAKHGPGLALIQFDAHCDTSEDAPGRIDHGTMLYHAVADGTVDPDRSIQVGIRTTYPATRFLVRDANAVHEGGIAATVAAIRARVGQGPCYLTFDIDCLDPAFAPGTGTPVCGGLASWQAKAILDRLDGLDLVGMDVVEVSPPYDHAEITALAGATVALALVALFARCHGGGGSVR